MSKKLICLLLILGFTGSAFAVDNNWTGMIDTDWADLSNWDQFAVPSLTDTTNIGIGIGSLPGTVVIGVGTSAGMRGGNAGKRTGTGTTADPYINGTADLTILGNLTNTMFLTIGREIGDVGAVHVDGSGGDGVWNLTKNIVVGRNGSGTLNVINGGTVDNSTTIGAYDGQLQVPAQANGIGRVYVSGGSTLSTGRIGIPAWGGGAHGGDGEIHISGASTVTATSLHWGDGGTSFIPTNGDFIMIYDTSQLILRGFSMPHALDAIGDGLIVGFGAATVYAYYDGANTIVEIPEPMTIALLGLGGLFLRRRKK